MDVLTGPLTNRFLLRCIFAVVLLQIVLMFTTVPNSLRSDVKRQSNLTGMVTVVQNSENVEPFTVQRMTKPNVTCPCDLIHTPFLYFRPFIDPLIIGKRRIKEGFLTIGIPTVSRPNTNRVYIYETLDAIIANTNPGERDVVTVVILMSDVNMTYNIILIQNLKSRYQQHFDGGFFQLIKTPPDIYPDLSKVKKTFKDSPERLKWRAKQNIDFAYLIQYSSDISKYYIQLEDDVISASNFVSDIDNFIKTFNNSWFLLEFSHLGFIGKLFRSSDLKNAASFLLHKYDVAPGDLLLGRLRTERGQPKPIHTNTSLFQHIGKFSSLKNKIMPSIDKTFKDQGKIDPSTIHEVIKGDNPPAKLDTNIITYNDYLPYYAYDGNSSTFFWGKAPNRSSYFGLIFYKPQNLSRIVISSGTMKTDDDSLQNLGVLSLARISDPTKYSQPKGITSCGTLSKLTEFVSGQVDTKATGNLVPSNVICVVIQFKRKMKTWVILRDIEIFVTTF